MFALVSIVSLKIIVVFCWTKSKEENNVDIAGNRVIYVGAGLGAIMLTGLLSYIFYKRWKRNVIPTKWRRVGTLQQVNLFPIKSCAPLKMSADDELICDVLGLRYKCIRDRALMLVNEKYEMVTARVYPKLVLVTTRVVGESKLILAAPGMEPLELDFVTLLQESPCEDIQTSVWGCVLEAMLCGEKYDIWFSRYVLNRDSGLHLVYYPYQVPVKDVNARLVCEPYITKEDTGTFGDATSYMLMNLASVDHLNSRMRVPIDPLQFRGNFHVNMDNKQPYVEDGWNWVRIGSDAIFRKVAPCTRCIFPNIIPTTGERDPSGNPLKELKKYRMTRNYCSPILGSHLGLRNTGVIKTNDVIYVNE